jgi:hypothetical protein
LDTDLLRASDLKQKTERRNFFTQTFSNIDKIYRSKEINHDEYVRLLNRLASFGGGEYNDYLDMLVGAATMGLLDVVIQEEISAFSPEAAQQRSKTITNITGIEPIKPEEEE